MPRRLRPLLLLVLPALAALGVPGCAEEERACYPTDWRACTCADGAEDADTNPDEGYQQCDDQGAGFGACNCSGDIPGFVSGAEPGSYMGTCTTDEECTETKLCHPFNAKGPHCTKACAVDSDCPEPSPGCNNMGVCKAP